MTTSNVVTYPVVVTVDNADGTLLPGLTVNAEIEVSKRDDVLKVANAVLRYKPSDDSAGGPAPRTRGGGGKGDDLTRTAAPPKWDGHQKNARGRCRGRGGP